MAIYNMILNFILFIFLLVQTIESEQANYKTFDYTFQVPTSTVKDLTPHSSQDVQQHKGEVQTQFLVKQPKQMGAVFQIQVSLKKSQFTESQQQKNDSQIDKNQAFKVPNVEGLFFQQFSWPIRKKTFYHRLSQSQSLSQKLISIVSATHTIKDMSSSSIYQLYCPIYALLSDGKIQKIIKDNQKLVIDKVYSYKTDDETKSQLFWQDATIYHSGKDELYILANSEVFTAQINTKSDSNQQTYGLQKLHEKNVLKVIQIDQELYAFTDTAVYRINEHKLQQIVKFDTVSQIFNLTESSFKDFAIFQNDLYLLDQKVGIIKFSFEQNQHSLLKIQYPEYSRQINVFNQTFLVTFQIEDQQYLAEYLFDAKGQAFYANKIYGHNAEENIQDIVLFSDYVVMSKGSQVAIGMHSLSRKHPILFHRKSETIESNSFIEEILQVRKLSSSISNQPAYMIVTGKTIELFQFQTNENHEFQQKWVQIYSQKDGQLQLDIKYTGTCRQNSKAFRSQYCSVNKSVKLFVKDSLKQTLNTWWIWVCGAFGIVFILLITLFVLRKYFIKKRHQFQSLISAKNNSNQSTIVEMTFQNTQPKGQVSETN